MYYGFIPASMARFRNQQGLQVRNILLCFMPLLEKRSDVFVPG